MRVKWEDYTMLLSKRFVKVVSFLVVFAFGFAFFGGEWARAQYIFGVHIAYAKGVSEEDLSLIHI